MRYPGRAVPPPRYGRRWTRPRRQRRAAGIPGPAHQRAGDGRGRGVKGARRHLATPPRTSRPRPLLTSHAPRGRTVTGPSGRLRGGSRELPALRVEFDGIRCKDSLHNVYSNIQLINKHSECYLKQSFSLQSLLREPVLILNHSNLEGGAF